MNSGWATTFLPRVQHSLESIQGPPWPSCAKAVLLSPQSRGLRPRPPCHLSLLESVSAPRHHPSRKHCTPGPGSTQDPTRSFLNFRSWGSEPPRPGPPQDDILTLKLSRVHNLWWPERPSPCVLLAGERLRAKSCEVRLTVEENWLCRQKDKCMVSLV